MKNCIEKYFLYSLDIKLRI